MENATTRETGDQKTKPALPRVQYGFAETAEMCGMPLSTFEQECRRGNGPTFYRIGRRKFTTLELIDEWLSVKVSDARATTK